MSTTHVFIEDAPLILVEVAADTRVCVLNFKHLLAVQVRCKLFRRDVTSILENGIQVKHNLLYVVIKMRTDNSAWSPDSNEGSTSEPT